MCDGEKEEIGHLYLPRWCGCMLCFGVVGLYKQSGVGAYGCPGQWCMYNATDTAAADTDDAFAVALPGSSLHWDSLPHLFAHFICPAAQCSRTMQAGRGMHEQHSSVLHMYMLVVVVLLLLEFVLAFTWSHYCVYQSVRDYMHTCCYSFNKHTWLMLLLTWC